LVEVKGIADIAEYSVPADHRRGRDGRRDWGDSRHDADIGIRAILTDFVEKVGSCDA
jgi:hypothetical protein